MTSPASERRPVTRPPTPAELARFAAEAKRASFQPLTFPGFRPSRPEGPQAEPPESGRFGLSPDSSPAPAWTDDDEPVSATFTSEAKR